MHMARKENLDLNQTEIISFDFSLEGKEELKKIPYSSNWPVVYMIHNNSEMYVGETCSINNRISQHLSNNERTKLERIEVVFDSTFNKSAVLDVEQSLIQLCGADSKYSLQNLNSGQSSKHNYFQREIYINKVQRIWDILKERGIVDHDYFTLKNSDLFKYSPYISLTEEQNAISNSIISDILEKLSNGESGTSVIHGSAGTGKTILAINMIFQLINADKIRVDVANTTYGFSDEQLAIHELHSYVKSKGSLKIGFVLPMTSLRSTIKKIFKESRNGLKPGIVIGPAEVLKRDYDVLFVDESHRLAQRKNITAMGAFDNTCKALNLNKYESTQLDWIVKCSKYQVLFYDENQSVKGSDLTSEQFKKSIGQNATQYRLKTQMRCLAADEYPFLLKDVFNCVECVKEFKAGIEGYDLRLFDDVNEMIEEIKSLNKTYGLCRNVAGYSWKWISKGKTMDEILQNNLEDINIGPYKYIWNMTGSEWIIRENSINEIGCIHTTQGYDLNYVGVIFGNEIDYDKNTNQITIDTSKFYDKGVKNSMTPEVIKKFIINAYKVMMLRGVKGCYVYACNPGLREYFRQYFDSDGA